MPRGHLMKAKKTSAWSSLHFILAGWYFSVCLRYFIFFSCILVSYFFCVVKYEMIIFVKFILDYPHVWICMRKGEISSSPLNKRHNNFSNWFLSSFVSSKFLTLSALLEFLSHEDLENVSIIVIYIAPTGRNKRMISSFNKIKSRIFIRVYILPLIDAEHCSLMISIHYISLNRSRQIQMMSKFASQQNTTVFGEKSTQSGSLRPVEVE